MSRYIQFDFTPSLFASCDALEKDLEDCFSFPTVTSPPRSPPFLSDGQPRDVRRQRRWDASSPGDAPVWHASSQPLARVTCPSASSVPLCSGLFSRRYPRYLMSSSILHQEGAWHPLAFTLKRRVCTSRCVCISPRIIQNLHHTKNIKTTVGWWITLRCWQEPFERAVPPEQYGPIPGNFLEFKRASRNSSVRADGYDWIVCLSFKSGTPILFTCIKC